MSENSPRTPRRSTRTPRTSRRLQPPRVRRRAAIREAAYLVGLLASAGALYMVLVLLPSRMKTQDLRDRRESLAQAVELTRERTKDLQRDALALRDDPWVVERALRSRLGYLRPGERLLSKSR